MSVPDRRRRVTVPELSARKGGTPIVSLTAYTTPMARQLDAHVDMLLVGDSLGMVLYGMESTLSVTLDMMIAHGAAVTRGASQACVVVDLPFGSYQESPEVAFRAAARVMAETGCAAVKLEGGVEMASTVAFLTKRGIPVLGHIGLTPQSVNTLGGYRARGRGGQESNAIAADAFAIADAGAFAIVIEGTVEPLARQLTNDLAVPTIGIGGSPACDGQILVTEDIVGLFNDFTPKFVKRYADLGEQVSAAARAYADDVRARRFPGPEHVFAARPSGVKPGGSTTE
ncbi:3-methyl-2-oxobutanoate hydroxymethyltransferase [Skermanella stibiiresistens SB22]|uniref:3-methyl-2-oxobutanoate hydroxymethyltransferase n=1 Tax=Skermanella stibiiresistens SB22 TaxID=1385369 RepID=W9H9Q0_9PROT|nr:3-methyl-2-oxobutanoate hydroxymethyltransferase [Skermanella stibiiresistens]EWY41432.1 3-methyl-2-oxobutanoate hydroxymethyltransferase [Skermanella stibiiresistens SB22]